MNKHLFNKSLLTLLSLLLLIACTSPLTAIASNSSATLVDEIEIVRRNQHLFLYLHSNAPVVHQSIEINASHLTLELEQIKLSPTVRTNYLNAPNIDTLLVKKLANNKVRLEIEGSDLSEPIVGFRELSGKAIPTEERVGGITLLAKPIAPVAIAPPVTKKPSVAVATTAPKNVSPLETEPTVLKAIVQKPLLTPKAPPLNVIQHNRVEQATAETTTDGTTSEASTTPPAWKALLLQVIMGASHHLDWCAYGLLGTMVLSLLASWGLKQKTRTLREEALPTMTMTTTIPTPPLARTTVPLYQQQHNNHNRPPVIKEAVPAAHQRILDRVQRQMEGVAPSIPNPPSAFQSDYKSTPKVPVSQASRQYQQQQNFVSGAKPTIPTTPLNETTTPPNRINGISTKPAGGGGERSNQKVVRPWQPERLGFETSNNSQSTSSTTASGAAFLEQMNAYLDPASKQNIQKGLRNNQQAL